MSNSIGDLKNSGLQGNNWPWQYKVLLGLDGIINAINATETEYEAQIVKATCPGPTPSSGYYLEIRIYNTTTGTFNPPVYYLPGSTTPVNLSACTKEYANDSLVLTQILTELIEQGLTLDAIETAVEGTLTVQATDLDIRTLTCDDKVSLCVNGNIVDALNPLPTTATVSFPTGSLTACNDAVAITFCDTLLTEFLAQGAALDDILTAVTGTLDVNVTNIVDVSGSNVLVTGTVTSVIECADSSIKICDTDGHTLDVNEDGSINLGALDATTGTFASLTYTGTGLANALDVNIINTGLDIRALTCDDKISLCNNGTEVDSSNPLPVSSAALTPTADGVGMYGSTDGGTNWTAVQVDTFGAVSTNANISGPLGIRDCTEAVSVALCDDQNLTLTAIENHVAPNDVTPNILISSGDAPVTITVPVYSITFFNNGSVDVNVSMDGGTSNALIPAGVTITMDAGGIKNSYPANTFIVGSTIAVGASMIVTYNS
jgi:hypothetical protein